MDYGSAQIGLLIRVICGYLFPLDTVSTTRVAGGESRIARDENYIIRFSIFLTGLSPGRIRRTAQFLTDKNSLLSVSRPQLELIP